MSNLLFKSGFESGVSLAAPRDFNGTAGWQDIVGTDTTTGYSWPIDVWHPALSSMQLLVADPGAVKNTIETTTGHTGAATQALHTQLLAASGSFPQDPYYMEGLHEQGDLYVKYWVKFDANLLQQMGPNQWQTFFEWKTGGDYRNIVYIYTDGNGNPYWHVQSDNNANGGLPMKEFWSADNKDVPVPVGEWFSFETLIHRSTGADGEIATAINGHTIADQKGANYGVNHDAIDRMMLFQNYGGGDKPISQWVDDVEIWDGKPTGNPPTATAVAVH
jgi:hypothetical protein